MHDTRQESDAPTNPVVPSPRPLTPEFRAYLRSPITIARHGGSYPWGGTTKQAGAYETLPIRGTKKRIRERGIQYEDGRQ